MILVATLLFALKESKRKHKIKDFVDIMKMCSEEHRLETTKKLMNEKFNDLIEEI